MRTRTSGKTNFHGYILPELNDAQTSLCVLGAILIVNPHVFNWSGTLWLAVISPAAFPAFFNFVMWGSESGPSTSRNKHMTMEEAIAIIATCIEERPDSTQREAPEIIASPSPEGIPISASGAGNKSGNRLGTRAILRCYKRQPDTQLSC